EPYGDQAQLVCGGKHACVNWVTGLARVEFDVPDGEEDDDTLDIGGLVTLRPSYGLLEFIIANVPAGMAPTAMRTAPGSEAMHLRAYYELLDTSRAAGTESMPDDDAPRLFVFTQSAGGEWIQIPPPKQSGRSKVTPPEDKWIVPEECTIGTANPP